MASTTFQVRPLPAEFEQKRRGGLSRKDTITHLTTAPNLKKVGDLEWKGIDTFEVFPKWRPEYYPMFKANLQSVMFNLDRVGDIDSMFKFKKYLVSTYGTDVGSGFFAFAYFKEIVWHSFKYHSTDKSDILITSHWLGKQTSIAGLGKYGSSHNLKHQGYTKRTPATRTQKRC